MLNITKTVFPFIEISVFNNDVMIDFAPNKKKMIYILTKAIVDSVLVGGIVFFASLSVLGVSTYPELVKNVYLSLASSIITCGLSLCIELKAHW